MHDDVPQFEHDPAYRAYRERVAGSSGHAGALADLALDVGSDLEITHEEEHDLIGRITGHLDELRQLGAALPGALMKCEYCGGARDRAPGGTLSLCFCQGRPCGHCGAGRTHRPGSDYFDAEQLEFWHVPHFGGTAQCMHCQEQSERLGSPGWAEGRGVLQSAAEALSAPVAGFRDELPPHTLLALHGGVEDWHDLELGSPPDGRPLFVGTALPELRYAPRGLEVATWCGVSHGEVPELLGDLLVRWQPPLNDEVETPWNR